MKVFIPPGWDHTQVLGRGGLGMAMSIQNMGLLKAETMSWHLTWQLHGWGGGYFPEASSLKQAVLKEAKASS